VLSVLVVPGCESQPKPTGSSVETVTLRIPFEESYADTEGAKRVVVCQFTDARANPTYLGEAVSARGDRVVRKFMSAGDPTWVLPKVLGGYLKRVGFNVSFSERLKTFDGDVVRETLGKFEADYLIAGRLEQFDVRVLSGSGRPVLTLVGLRLDVYNKDGELRMYMPAPFKRAGLLEDRADDPAAVAEFVSDTVRELFDNAFDNTYFVKVLDLELATVRELMKAQPVPPATEPEETTPETTTPETTTPETMTPETPKEPTAAEKAEAERLRKARELEKIVEDEKKRTETEPK